MQTRAITISLTQTATMISAKIGAAFQRMLAELGLGALAREHGWDGLEGAVTTWLAEQTLETVVLELYSTATNKLVTRFEVGVEYSASDGSPRFRQDIETTALAARKAAPAGVASGTRFRIVVRTKPHASPVPGWGDTTMRDATHLKRRSMGELASGPGISCSLDYWVG